ncbi:MAG: hypothetical protein AMS14_02730 [Planctomycetes bacterium DG_20]|nr:MAG: hypothetical protein AMS14_02730 [Planctomycetes bacterium DG_20]
MSRKVLVALALSLSAVGCLDREAVVKQLRTDDPRMQAAAIARIVRAYDATLAGELIELLESEDEGVRFMAATALHKLTGRKTNFHFATPEERKKIIAGWRAWWGSVAGGPAPAAATGSAEPKEETGKGEGDASGTTSKESRS